VDMRYEHTSEGGELPDIIHVADRAWLPALPGEQGSVDLPGILRGLNAIGFDGPIVVACPRHPQVESPNLARVWHDYLRRVMEKAAAAQAPAHSWARGHT